MLSELWGANALDSIKPEIHEWALQEVSDYPGSELCSLQAKAAEAFLSEDYDNASRFLNESLDKLNVEYSPDDYLMSTYLMMIDVFLKKNDLSNAHKYIRLAEVIPAPDNDFYNRVWKKSLLERFYRQKGMTAKADSIMVTNLKLRDSLYNSRNQTIVSELEHKHLTSALHEDLQTSERERELLESSNKSKTTVIWVVTCSAVLTIGLLLWLLHRGHRLRETNNALFKKNLESIKTISKLNTANNPGTEFKEEGESKVSEPSRNIPAESEETVNETERLQDIYQKIVTFSESGRAVCALDFDIEQMGKLTGIRPRDISRAINSIAGKNFRTFIVEERIKEACRIIVEAENGEREHIKIDNLAEEVGFRSRTHFSTAFKSVTGMTCTEFFRHARKNKAQESV